MVAVDRQRADFTVRLSEDGAAILTAAVTEQRIVNQVERRLRSNTAAVAFIRVVADDRAVDHAEFARRLGNVIPPPLSREVLFSMTLLVIVKGASRNRFRRHLQSSQRYPTGSIASMVTFAARGKDTRRRNQTPGCS